MEPNGGAPGDSPMGLPHQRQGLPPVCNLYIPKQRNRGTCSDPGQATPALFLFSKPTLFSFFPGSWLVVTQSGSEQGRFNSGLICAVGSGNTRADQSPNGKADYCIL